VPVVLTDFYRTSFNAKLCQGRLRSRLAEYSPQSTVWGGVHQLKASEPQRSNRMEVSICAELLAGGLETCGCQVADGIASWGAVLFIPWVSLVAFPVGTVT